MTLEDMMERALLDLHPTLDVHNTRYHCDCTRERVERALISIGKAELEKMAQEQSTAEVSCKFCDKTYKIDLKELFVTGEKS